MNRPVIAIGADHYNTLWIIRSIGMAGFHAVAVILNGLGRSFVGASHYCKECYIVKDETSAVDLLLSLNFKERVPIIASGDPAAMLLDGNFKTLSSKYILHCCGAGGGNLAGWMDKSRMLNAARDCGLTIPFSRALDLSVPVTFEDIPYPCLIKPEVSAYASKNNFRVCHNQIELENAIIDVKDVCDRVILQEFVQKDYEYLIYGVRTLEGEIILPGGLRKIHTCESVHNMGMASYAYCTKSIPRQLVDFNHIRIFLHKLDYHGVFSVEFMITKDKAYFLEINLRNDGTVYYTTKAGVNIPALWAASAYGMDISKMPQTFKRLRTYGMNEANYVKYTLRSQSLFKSIKEILKVRAFSLIKFNDMKPVFARLVPILFAFRQMWGGVERRYK